MRAKVKAAVVTMPCHVYGIPEAQRSDVKGQRSDFNSAWHMPWFAYARASAVVRYPVSRRAPGA